MRNVIKNFISIVMVLMLLVGVIGIPASTFAVKTINKTTTKGSSSGSVTDRFAEKHYCDATIDDSFTDDMVLVVIIKYDSKINQTYNAKDMATVVNDKYLQQVDGRYELNKAAQAIMS